MTSWLLRLAGRLDRLADWIEHQADRLEVSMDIARIRLEERRRARR